MSRAALDCVAFILVRDGRVLAEVRKLTKALAPGAVALPGGHVDGGESLDGALRRELWEELGVVPDRVIPVCTLLHWSEELRRLHYFAVPTWHGDIQNREAEALVWVPLADAAVFDFDVDRTAVAEYLRLGINA